MCHQQDARLPSAFPRGQNVDAHCRRCGNRFYLCSGLAQFVRDDGADLAEAGLIAGAGVDIDQALKQMQCLATIALGGGQDLGVCISGAGQMRGAQQQRCKGEAGWFHEGLW
ncbi:hypothetical protein D9M70_632100 [compost metagenome]